MKIGIIGIGYVGLPLAVLCAKKGHSVVGVTIDEDQVKKVNKKIVPFADPLLQKELEQVDIYTTVDFSSLNDRDAILICVPTPVNEDHKPDLTPLKSACSSIIPFLKKNQLIVVESTIYPGIMEEVVKPILEKSGLKTGEDFYLAHCPERVDPANEKWTIRNIPRCIGAFSKEGLVKATTLYESIIDADVLPLSTIKAAEATKIMENSFRDVNIAFINEMAKSFEKAGIDVTEVIRGAKTKPFGFMPHYPGCGVGGHCIPVDPYYLIDKAASIGFDHKFLRLAREINESMPLFTVGLMKHAIVKRHLDFSSLSVGLLGLAYKGNVSDLRESPALDILKKLQSEKFKNINIYDPYIPEQSTFSSLSETLEKSDVIIIATDHKEFLTINPIELDKKSVKIVIDGRNCLKKEDFKDSEIIYKGIGR